MPARTSALPVLPPAPSGIRAGSSLAEVLGSPAIRQLAANLRWARADFPADDFIAAAESAVVGLGIMQRGTAIACVLRHYLPLRFEEAVAVLLASLTPPLTRTDGNGLQVFFYLPHTCFVAEFGRSTADRSFTDHGGIDPFPTAMKALHALTRRFTAEFAIRPFLAERQDETLAVLRQWITDPCPHVRRLCSEGTRPRLPWAMHLPAFKRDPSPVLSILTALRDDPERYVVRSVANHLGDIAKYHPALVYDLCADWLNHASAERRWLIRHALRLPAKQGDPRAVALREQARR